MSRFFPSSSGRAIVLGLVLSLLSASAAAETLRIGGTGSALATMARLAEAFRAVQPAAEFQIPPSLGSSGGIKAVTDGAIDIAVSARPLKPEEAGKGLTEIAIAKTPLVLVTSHPHPQGLKRAGLAALYGDARATWSDGSPLRIVLRPASESDTRILGEYFPGMEAALQAARERPDVPVAATDQDNAALAQSVTGSLAAVTLAQLITEELDLRALALDGVEPTVENLANGSYPPFKPFYLIVPEAPSPLALRFIAFVRSPEGLRILRESGSLPVVPPAAS